MAFPAVVAVGLVAALKTAFTFLVTQIGILFLFLIKSFLGKAIIGAVIFFGLNYLISTKIDAFGWIIEQINASEKFSDIPIVFTALGTILQSLRIDDILLVYINAYALGFVMRSLLNMGISSRRVGS